jgi:hypothetical protein
MASYFKLDLISECYNENYLPKPLCVISTLWAKTLAARIQVFVDMYCLIFRFMPEDSILKYAEQERGT